MMNWRARATLLICSAVMLSLPAHVRAQPCGGTMGHDGGAMAWAIDPTVCTYAAVTGTSKTGVQQKWCHNTVTTGGKHYLKAQWSKRWARTHDSGGCIFRCPPSQCFVDFIGLPVELLSFGVE